MSQIFRFMLLSILVLFTFACGLITNPLNQAKGLASTAEAIATANPYRYPHLKHCLPPCRYRRWRLCLPRCRKSEIC